MVVKVWIIVVGGIRYCIIRLCKALEFKVIIFGLKKEYYA